MPIQQTSEWCGRCGRYTLHVRDTSPMPFGMAMVHGSLFICTCGLWLIPFVIITALTLPKNRPFICQQCGQAHSKNSPFRSP